MTSSSLQIKSGTLNRKVSKIVVSIASDKERQIVLQQSRVVEKNTGDALKLVRTLQGWKTADIEKRIIGIEPESIRRYCRPSKPDNRHVHITSLLCWMMQVSLPAITMGKQLQKFWPNLDTHGVNAVLYCGPLPTRWFETLVEIILDRSLRKNIDLRDYTYEPLKALRRFEDHDFLMPSQVNVHDFGWDYHNSVAQALRKIRTDNNLSSELLADLICVPDTKYHLFENPNYGMGITMEVAVRMKLALGLEDTTFFLDEMKAFKGFALSRQVQQQREAIILNIFDRLPSTMKAEYSKTAKDFLYWRVN